MMKRPFTIGLALLTGLALPAAAQEGTSTLSTTKDKVSYAIGYNIGMNLQRQQYDVDPKLVEQGIRDVLENNSLAMTETEARQALESYQQELMKKRQEEQAAEASVHKTAGAAFLKENATKEGVVTLESGLQYKVLTEGSGESPGPNDTVKVHYRGTLIDGTEFDSSYSRGQPAQFRVNGVIAGWTEALQKMSPGAKWQLFIPSDLAYGDRAQGGTIKPGSTLLFDVELLEVIKPKPITSDIIKVPSAEEMKKGAKIETIKASDLERLEAEAKKAQENQ